MARNVFGCYVAEYSAKHKKPQSSIGVDMGYLPSMFSKLLNSEMQINLPFIIAFQKKFHVSDEKLMEMVKQYVKENKALYG
jgi:hypothetical protein